MFFKMRKSRKSGEGQSSVPAGDKDGKEESGESVALAGDNLVADGEKASLEEHIHRKPIDLEEADEQLGQLGGADGSRGEDGGGEVVVEELFTKPNPPQELAGEPENQASVEGKDLDSLLAGAGEEEKAGQEGGGENEDSLYDIFNDEEEEEENPLAGLIANLPDVTAQELFDETKEVDGLLREWR